MNRKKENVLTYFVCRLTPLWLCQKLLSVIQLPSLYEAHSRQMTKGGVISLVCRLHGGGADTHLETTYCVFHRCCAITSPEHLGARDMITAPWTSMCC